MTGMEQLAAIQRLAQVSEAGRLYVHTAGTGEPVEVGRYLSGLGPDEYEVRGPAPLRLVLSFPKPRLSVVSKVTEAERERLWVRTLTGLPVRRAALRLAGGRPCVMEAVSVADVTVGAGAETLLSGAVARSGQPKREVEETVRWRQEQVERVATGKSEPREANDKAAEVEEKALEDKVLRATTASPRKASTPLTKRKQHPTPIKAQASVSELYAHVMQNDEMQNDEMQNDEMQNDEMQNDEMQNDEMQNDPGATAGDVGEDGSLV